MIKQKYTVLKTQSFGVLYPLTVYELLQSFSFDIRA